MSEWAVRGIRGATTVPANDRETIVAATEELVRQVLAENGIAPEQVASVIFTVTDDLNVQFPAVGARRVGLTDAALLCAREVAVPGSQQGCIRALFHVNLPRPQREVRHVYLREARAPRPDLAGPGEEAGEAWPALRLAAGRVVPYVPGKPVWEVQRELGLAEVVKLASNENPLGPSPRALEALRGFLSQLHYYPDGGAGELRSALSRRLGLSPGCILVGNGSDELIKLLVEAYLNPGDEVVTAAPTFSEYGRACQLLDGRVVEVPLTADLRHDLPAMARAIGPRTKLVFVCNPNNPTGTWVTGEEVAAFLGEVPPGVIVVFDEAYREYADDPTFPDTVALVRSSGRPVLVLRTFSKIYGLAGLRIGYGIGPERLIEGIARVKEPFNVNAAAQVAALAALEDEEHLARSRELNRQEREGLLRQLTALGLRCVPSQANFVWVDTGRDSRAVFQALLERGIIVRTGDVFGMPAGLRITVGTPDQNRRLCQALREVLAEVTPLAAVARGTQGEGDER